MAYTLQGRSGTVYFHQGGTITSENKKQSGKVTSYPIENNSKITDHFEKDPTKGTIRGILIGGGATVATLEAMMDNADILTYSGSYRMENIVLVDLDFSTDSSNKNGFSFTASYQRVSIVGAQYVPIGDTPLMSAQDAGKSETVAETGNAETAQNGLQTTAQESISSSAYAAYVDTFNSKITPSSGPMNRSTPSYSGF